MRLRNSIGQNSGAETKAHTLSSRKKNMPWSFQLNQTKTAAGTFFVMRPSQSYDDSQLDCVSNQQLFAEFMLDHDQFLMEMKILTYISSKSGSFSHQMNRKCKRVGSYTYTLVWNVLVIFNTFLMVLFHDPAHELRYTSIHHDAESVWVLCFVWVVLFFFLFHSNRNPTTP